LSFIGLHAGVDKRSTERQKGEDNEQKISNVTTGHGFLPGSGPNIQTAWEQGGSRKRNRMIVDAATERQTNSGAVKVNSLRGDPNSSSEFGRKAIDPHKMSNLTACSPVI